MDREKQIEEMEMANEIYETLMLEAECPLSGMDCAIIADLLVNKGYRKQSDVAREIFEEIEKKVKASIVIYFEDMNKEHIKDTPLYDRCSGSVFAFKNMEDFLAQLKKKWEVEE